MLRTADQFLEGLHDNRRVVYRGTKVQDVVAHSEIGIAARHASIDFELAESQQYRKLAVATDEDGDYSAYYRVPRTSDHLAARSRLIEAATAQGATLVLLIKEIGTDALFALMRVLQRYEHDGYDRLMSFYAECRDNDRALAVAQTDVKGDRSLRPSKQQDPDSYLRVVEQRNDGIIVRGAKAHTSCAPYVDNIIVLPSRTMMPGDEPYSVSFQVPADTEGLTFYVSDFLDGGEHPWTHPVSHAHKMLDTLTVFDDVFVPWEDVFFIDSTELAGATALSFVEFHRFTAVSYKLPLLDAFVGAGIAIAEANGILAASHVRDKLTWLAGYAETVRGLIELAAQRATTEHSIAYPHVFTTNLAKWTFAREFHAAIEIVQDLAGGLLVTGPSGKDWESPEVRPVLEKYLAGSWPAAERMAMMNLISDLTARLYAGYQSVLAIHAEGSLEAEKMAMFRAYDPKPAVTYAKHLAGLEPNRA
ncbi:MAG: 4-hydroxyphenylacetate 3-hydroxylase N-terminal domain-containing protein [Acidimicrobiia bacterium]